MRSIGKHGGYERFLKQEGERSRLLQDIKFEIPQKRGGIRKNLKDLNNR